VIGSEEEGVDFVDTLRAEIGTWSANVQGLIHANDGGNRIMEGQNHEDFRQKKWGQKDGRGTGTAIARRSVMLHGPGLLLAFHRATRRSTFVKGVSAMRIGAAASNVLNYTSIL